MVKVYDLNWSRSIRITWLLQELGEDYELVSFKRNPETRRAPEELRKVHPLGKAPVIEDDGKIIAESGAIIEYLLRKFDTEGKLAPVPGEEEWERHIELLHYVEGSLSAQLMPLLVEKLLGETLPQKTKYFFENEKNLHLKYVSEQIRPSGFLLDRGFSAVDIHMAFTLQMAETAVGLEDYPNIVSYLERLKKRPAYHRALGKQQ